MVDDPTIPAADQSCDVGTNAGAIIRTMERLQGLAHVDLNGNPRAAIALPRGLALHSLKPFLDEYLPHPERKRGVATLDTLDSFIAHCNRFKGADSAVFATPSTLVAVYDYHGHNAAHCEHRAEYKFPLSPEWRAWCHAHERSMVQLAFAEFIESHIAEVTTPKEDDREHFGELGFTLASPAQLLALSRGLMVRVESEAVSKPNLSTGEIEVGFKEQHTDATGAALKVPGGFMLLIPPHEGGALYRIPVRLRYRVSNGKITWSVHLHRLEAVLRDALKHACETVIDRTALPLFHGCPESLDDE